ncbi:unnamed protein product [Discosporangium mesarthrocarpum]
MGLAVQAASAVAHCHQRGVLLQDIKPDDVLVTPNWVVKLQPNFMHARLGQHLAMGVVSENSADRPQALSPDRGDAKANRGEERRRASREHCMPHCPSGELVAPFSFATVPDYQSPEISQISRDQTGAGADRDKGGDVLLTPCTSDIWAWALITLQMFSDKLWDVGRGEEGLKALGLLERRRVGVEHWDTDDVIRWLLEDGLWCEEMERELRVFKITGRHLLVPTTRREVVVNLGLFITRMDLVERLWEGITGSLQRWAMPTVLIGVLRRCLADRPNDRFSTMDEVCQRLYGLPGLLKPPFSLVEKPSVGETAADLETAATVINDIGACLRYRGMVAEAEKHYKLALLISNDLPEPHYNLGLLYITQTYDKFEEARIAFQTAAKIMGPQDRRHKVSLELAKHAERKSKFYQSQEVMRALSGKYSPPSASKGTTLPRKSLNTTSVRNGDSEAIPRAASEYPRDSRGEGVAKSTAAGDKAREGAHKAQGAEQGTSRSKGKADKPFPQVTQRFKRPSSSFSTPPPARPQQGLRPKRSTIDNLQPSALKHQDR